MFKFSIYFYIILILIVLNESKLYKKGNLSKNSINGEESWPNLWFPHPPNYEEKVNSETINVAGTPELKDLNKGNSLNYSGLWFPHPPNYQKQIDPSTITTSKLKTNVKGFPDKIKASDWSGLWFPFPPNYRRSSKKDEQNSLNNANNWKNRECDNGKEKIGVDFDPEDKRHSYNYLCFGNRSAYEPNINTSALMKEYVIPAAYEPPVKCLYESIEYEQPIPTYGAFRPLAPKFGTYNYLPPQRWLHSLADGAIVLLFHPCAFAGQIEQLQNTLKSCLYRHIITPSLKLTPQRPLALIAWGKSLQMSVVDDDIVIKFIKDNAKKGFKQKQQILKMYETFYDAGLLNEAHLVTDEQDIEICGYKVMR